MRGDRDDTHLAKYPRRGRRKTTGLEILVLHEASAVGGQLRLDVYPADGTLLIGGQPLVDTRLMEEVHAG